MAKKKSKMEIFLKIHNDRLYSTSDLNQTTLKQIKGMDGYIFCFLVGPLGYSNEALLILTYALQGKIFIGNMMVRFILFIKSLFSSDLQ